MKAVTFRFDEFDEAIDEAIEDDIKEADGGGMLLMLFVFHCNGDKFLLIWEATNVILSLKLCSLQFLLLYFWNQIK